MVLFCGLEITWFLYFASKAKDDCDTLNKGLPLKWLKWALFKEVNARLQYPENPLTQESTVDSWTLQELEARPSSQWNFTVNTLYPVFCIYGISQLITVRYYSTYLLKNVCMWVGPHTANPCCSKIKCTYKKSVVLDRKKRIPRIHPVNYSTFHVVRPHAYSC